MSEIASPTPDGSRPRRRRGLWIALFTSLAVNLFLAGWIATSWIGNWAPGGRVSASRAEFYYRPALRALPESQRRAVQNIWDERAQERRARAREFREARVELRRVLTADQMDTKALEAAVVNLRARADAVHDHIGATLVRVATTLPPEARKAYFNAGLSRASRRRSDDARPQQ